MNSKVFFQMFRKAESNTDCARLFSFQSELSFSSRLNTLAWNKVCVKTGILGIFSVPSCLKIFMRRIFVFCLSPVTLLINKMYCSCKIPTFLTHPEHIPNKSSCILHFSASSKVQHYAATEPKRIFYLLVGKAAVCIWVHRCRVYLRP